jgi:hypothetical protein
MRTVLSSVMVLGAVLCCGQAYADPGDGTLVLELKPIEAKVKIKAKYLRQFEKAPVMWGMSDDHVVINMVNEEYVNARLYSNLAGEQREFELAPGQYYVTCIGYVPTKTGTTDVEDALSAGAFFNDGVMSFEVKPGSVTRLEITPDYTKQKFNWAIKVFLPEYRVRVFRDGELLDEAVINTRTESSISWDDYSGNLKAD